MSTTKGRLRHLIPTGQVAQANDRPVQRAFRRDLSDFAAAIIATPIADRTTWTRLRDRWERLTTLLGYSPEMGTTASIGPLLAGCEAGFAAMARRGTEDEKAALVVRITATRDYVERHPPNNTHSLVSPALPHRQSYRDVAFLLCWCSKDLTPQRRNDLLAPLGPRAKVIWHLTQRRFARSEAKVFQYA